MLSLTFLMIQGLTKEKYVDFERLKKLILKDLTMFKTNQTRNKQN